jgi:hypothetical protein
LPFCFKEANSVHPRGERLVCDGVTCSLDEEAIKRNNLC